MNANLKEFQTKSQQKPKLADPQSMLPKKAVTNRSRFRVVEGIYEDRGVDIAVGNKIPKRGSISSAALEDRISKF